MDDPFAKVNAEEHASLDSESGAEPTGSTQEPAAQDSPAETAQRPPEPKPEVSKQQQEQPSEKPATPSSDDPWLSQEAKEVLKGLTPQELKRLREREKNLMADYTRKTQRLSEERRQFDEQQKAMQKQLEFLQSERFKRLADLDEMYRDPTTQAKIDKVLEEMEVPQDKVVDIKLKRLEQSIQEQMAQLRREKETLDQAAREQRRDILRAKIQKTAEEHGVAPRTLNAYIAAKWDEAKESGVEVTDELAFVDEATRAYLGELDEYATKRSTRLQQQKLEQQKAQPLKGTAQAQSAGPGKKDKIMGFDDPRLDAITKQYLGEA